MVAFTVIPIAGDAAQRLIGRWASPQDRLHGGRWRNRSAQDQSVLARAALRALLHRETGRKDWDIRIGARGKPYIKTGPPISLSHSRGWVACALGTRHPVGVDIEAHRPRAYAAIADYAFGPAEQELVRDGGPDAFYRIWTLREAMGKATGEGLALATDGRDRAHIGPSEGFWKTEDGHHSWLLAHYRLQPDISLAIALDAQDDAECAAPPEYVDLSGLS